MLLPNKRFRIVLNYIIGPLLFAWLSWSIYRQIQHQPDVQESWQRIVNAVKGGNKIKIVLVVLLMMVNWGIEARKWQIQVSGVQRISYAAAFQATLAGQAMGFNTVNRMGEPVVRAAFLAEGNRLRGIMLSFVGSMAQIIATFIMGAFCLLSLRFLLVEKNLQIPGLSLVWMDALTYVIAMGVMLFTLAYFRLSGLIAMLEKIPLVARYRYFIEKLEDFHWGELTRLLSLSFGRYLVFLLQYYLLLQVFDVQMSLMESFIITGVFLTVMAIVPTIALAELGFRGKLGLLLFGLLSTNTVGIIATAAGIWLVNLILPAIAGTLFILRIRLFKSKGSDA